MTLYWQPSWWLHHSWTFPKSYHRFFHWPSSPLTLIHYGVKIIDGTRLSSLFRSISIKVKSDSSDTDLSFSLMVCSSTIGNVSHQESEKLAFLLRKGLTNLHQSCCAENACSVFCGTNDFQELTFKCQILRMQSTQRQECSQPLRPPVDRCPCEAVFVFLVCRGAELVQRGVLD